MPINWLVDTHAHLDEIEGLEQVIAEAKSFHVLAIVAVGSDLASNQKVLALAQLHKGFVYPALGLHPWTLKDSNVDSTLEFIEANADKAIGIGEIGLDYHKRVREKAEKDFQKYALSEVLKIAKRHHKPALVHSRYAWRDALTLVEDAHIEKAVFHWYTGTSSVLRDIIGDGYYISVTPAVEYHEEHRRAAKETPLDKLFLETDSPVIYGRGTGFEFESRPAHIIKSLTGVCKLKQMSQTEVAEITTHNALKFFGLQYLLPVPPSDATSS